MMIGIAFVIWTMLGGCIGMLQASYAQASEGKAMDFFFGAVLAVFAWVFGGIAYNTVEAFLGLL